MIDLSYRNIQGKKESKQETANCYVISEPGEYCFPLVYGCGIKNGETNKESFSLTVFSNSYCNEFFDYKNKPIKSANINYKCVNCSIEAWDSNRKFIQNIRIINDYVYFSIPYVPESGANYILAVRDKYNTIVWSWHIWLWKDKLENQKIGNFEILNTNLATKKSLDGTLKNWYYQWGKKDPVCYYLRRFKFAILPPSNIGETISNPTVYYSLDYHWTYLDGSIFNYWNSNSCHLLEVKRVEKTIYDPCPRGYNIPRTNLFENLPNAKWDSIKKGLRSDNIFLPAEGTILVCLTNTRRMYLETSGYYWTSGNYSLSSGFIYHFDKYKKEDIIIHTTDGNHRGMLYSVRPQKEEL